MSEIILEAFKLYLTEFLGILLMLGIISFFIGKIEMLIFNFKK